MDVLRRHEGRRCARAPSLDHAAPARTGSWLRADLDIQLDEMTRTRSSPWSTSRRRSPCRRAVRAHPFKLSEKAVQRFLRTGDA